MVHALRSRRIITPHGERDGIVTFADGIILGVHDPGDLPAGAVLENLGDAALLPGLIDVHTHINEPGRTEWEGFATATRAAAAGGFTTVIDMPLNCLPETTDVEALQVKRDAAQRGGSGDSNQCMVDYALWGGAVDGNQHQLEPLALAGVPGFKCFLIYPGCDGFTSIDRANLELALPHIAQTGLPLLVHAELAAPIDAAVARLNSSGADWRTYATYLASRPDEAELQAIQMLLDLCRQYRFRLHIVHLATALALPMLAAAKAEGLPVTVETCPHYLHCAAEDIADGATLFKCAPPIRSRDNREALWQGLLDGTIDLIATDHSPCPPAMKRLTATQPGEEAGRLDQAWGGIASLSVAFPLLAHECVARNIPLTRLMQWMSAAPALLAGLDMQVGSIEPGKHANFVVLDTSAVTTVNEDTLHYRHKVSPYMAEQFRGKVTSTYLRGERIFHEGTFPLPPKGREYALHTHRESPTTGN